MEKHLRSLGLHGMAGALEARLRETMETNLTGMEFLGRLLADEKARRDQVRYDSRMRRSRLDGQMTFVTYDPALNPDLPQDLLRGLETCQFVEDASPVMIMGPVGTGKSHVAQALGHEAVRRGYDVLFVGHAELLGQLDAARRDGKYERKLKQLGKLPLLIVDDFALRPMTVDQEERFYDVVAARYRRRATVVTTNLHESEWADAFQNKVLGAAAIDRLRHDAYFVTLDGKSKRTPRTVGTIPAAGDDGKGVGIRKDGPAA
jgi:DNA replication protein DnaC